MSWLYSRALVEEYLEANCLDGEQSAPLSGNPTPQAYCAPDKMTDFSRLSRYGMTYKLLMDIPGEELSMSSVVAFHVRTLVQQERAQELTESAAGCGEKWHASFARYDPDTSSWRTAQCSLLGGLDEFLETWPEWGLMLAGECSMRPPLERRTTEPGFTWLLTPTAQSWKAWTFRSPLKLIRVNHADGNLQEQLMRLYQRMTTPRCQEILMMWPEGWTDSRPLEMDGFQQWLHEQCEF